MQSQYRDALPQLGSDIFLTDAGLETDLIFNKGIDIPEFAAHTLLPSYRGRQAVIDYFSGFLQLASEYNTGFILDAPTWKAHVHWANDLGESEDELRSANHQAIAFIARMRKRFTSNQKPIVLNGLIGPRGDAYAPQETLAVQEAEDYHARQIGWLAETEVDMVSALTFTEANEATGVVRAATKAGLPVVVSFTVETDGKLPSGQPLDEAICAVDTATDQAAAYFMVNCAHPDHFADQFDDAQWTRRIRGLRCNASRMSHAELDCCATLDAGDPDELAKQYCSIKERTPWLNVFGGCCGSDLRHVTQIANAIAA